MKNGIHIFLFLLFFSTVSGQDHSDEKSGLKLFDDWNPDKTGKSDVTDVLQKAINYSIVSGKTLYISPGTYLVSKQIIAHVFPGEYCGDQTGKGALRIYGDQFRPPVIKLEDSTNIFAVSKTGIVPLIIIRQAERDAANCLFWSTFRNICIDLGKGNINAAALDFDAAQDCELANVKVYGAGIFQAGFTGVPGRNALISNIEVIGGNYGFYLNKTSLGFCMSSIKCYFQNKAGIYFNSSRAGSITGLEIKECSGNAVIGEGNGSAQSGHLVLTDAFLEVKNSDRYAIKYNDRAVFLKNVFIQGTNKILKGDDRQTEENVERHTLHIRNYSYTPEYINKVRSYDVIEGKKLFNNEIKDFEIKQGYFENMADIHLPGELGAFNGEDVVWVTDFGAVPDDDKDDKAAFEEAIKQQKKIFVPAGNYHLSSPLVLKDSTLIFGDPGKNTWLIPTYTAYKRTWLVQTPDNKGWCAVQDLVFDNPDKTFFGGIHWQTSSGYIYNVRNYPGSGHLEQDKHNYEFSGNAGCRVYGITEHNNFALWKIPSGIVPEAHPEFRKVYVENNANPITFYGLNLERGGSPREGVKQYPFFEARNARNIRILGSKTETDGPVYKLSGVQNFFLSSVLATKRKNGQDIIVFDKNCHDIELTMLNIPDITGHIVIDSISDPIPKTDFVGVYKLGDFNHQAFLTFHPDSLFVKTGPDIYLEFDNHVAEVNATSDSKFKNSSWSVLNYPSAIIEKTGRLSAKITFEKSGIFYACIHISDSSGNNAEDFQIIHVNVTEPEKITVDAGPDIILGESDKLAEVMATVSNESIMQSCNWTVLNDTSVDIEKTGALTATIFFNEPGTYHVQVDVSDTLGYTDKDHLLITVQPAATEKFSIMACPDQILEMDNPVAKVCVTVSNQGIVDSCSWTVLNNSEATVQKTGLLSAEITFDDPGIFYVEVSVTDSLGTSFTDYLMVTINPGKINSNKMLGSYDVIVKPNPVKKYISIQTFDVPYFFVKIYDSNGLIRKEKKIVNSTGLLNCMDLNNGIYYIKIIIQQKVYTKKLIVNRI